MSQPVDLVTPEPPLRRCRSKTPSDVAATPVLPSEAELAELYQRTKGMTESQLKEQVLQWQASRANVKRSLAFEELETQPMDEEVDEEAQADAEWEEWCRIQEEIYDEELEAGRQEDLEIEAMETQMVPVSPSEPVGVKPKQKTPTPGVLAIGNAIDYDKLSADEIRLLKSQPLHPNRAQVNNNKKDDAERLPTLEELGPGQKKIDSMFWKRELCPSRVLRRGIEKKKRQTKIDSMFLKRVHKHTSCRAGGGKEDGKKEKKEKKEKKDKEEKKQMKDQTKERKEKKEKKDQKDKKEKKDKKETQEHKKKKEQTETKQSVPKEKNEKKKKKTETPEAVPEELAVEERAKKKAKHEKNDMNKAALAVVEPEKTHKKKKEEEGEEEEEETVPKTKATKDPLSLVCVTIMPQSLPTPYQLICKPEEKV